MAVTPVGSATTATSTGQTVTIPVPTGVQAGDLLIVSIAAYSTVDFPDAESIGFTRTETSALWDLRALEVWWRFAPDPPPASYDFGINFFLSTNTGSMRAYRGADPDEPINDDSVIHDNLSTDTIVIPEVTTTRPRCLGLAVVGGENVTWTAPAGMTERWDVVNAGSEPTSQAGAEDDALLPLGASGTRTFTASAGGPKAGIFLAIAPARPWHVGYVGSRS